MKKLPIEVDELTQKLKERENTSLNHEDIKTDKNIKLWTGTTNKVALDALFTAVTRNLKKVRYRSGPLKFSLKGKNLTKNLVQTEAFQRRRVLADQDETSPGVKQCRPDSKICCFHHKCLKYFHNWIKVLANQLRSMVYNPSIDVVKKTLPKKFRKPGYSKVRHIIDCREIFIEIHNDPVLKAATWSDRYSKRCIQFCIRGLGWVNIQCPFDTRGKFFVILEAHDEVMADRGFTIMEDLLIRNARLHIMRVYL